MTPEMSYTRKERRKKEIARSKERTELRYKQRAGLNHETEDGLIRQGKLKGFLRWDREE